MNQLIVTIDGINYTNAVLPFKYGQFLDEQLDYATLTIARINKEVIKISSRVEININDGGSSKSLYYRVSEDSARETPNGSGFYTHDLMLIEETKYLEGFMVESLCVTNAGGRDYVMISPTQQNYSDFTAISFLFSNDNKTPLVTGTQMSLPDIVPYENTSGITDYTQTIKVFLANAFTSFVEKEIYNNTTTNHTGTVPGTVEIYSGVNILTYTYTVSFTAGGRPTTFNYKSSFSIYGQPNKYPLKPWTIKEVIERVLELAEPLVWDKEAKAYITPPKFKFRYKTNLGLGNAEEKALFDQYSPEFTFTRSTLREVLQTIGGYIHAEPRLDENGYVYFERYGEREVAEYYDYIKKGVVELNTYNYSGKTISHSIEQACTRIDSYVDNLVNQISIGKGTVGQPYQGGYQSLRTDSTYLRFTEDNMLLPTAYPVLQPIALYWVDNSGATPVRYEITNYLFEANIYNSQLSSYTEVYPSSKAYAVYYTQGEKNIKGFFFKNPDWSGGALANYSIVNILRLVTGNNNLTFSDYTKLCFELVYIPTYSARVGHGKQYIGDWLKYPRTIAQKPKREYGGNAVLRREYQRTCGAVG